MDDEDFTNKTHAIKLQMDLKNEKKKRINI